MSNKKKLFKKDQLVVLVMATGGCGCSTLTRGTIVKTIREVDEYSTIDIVSFEDQPISTRVHIEKLRSLQGKERLLAKAAFKKANKYEYASVDNLSFIKK